MSTYYDDLHAQGIRVQVFDSNLKGPFEARVSCGVTGAFLGGAEGCKSIDDAISRGKKLAQRSTY